MKRVSLSLQLSTTNKNTDQHSAPQSQNFTLSTLSMRRASGPSSTIETTSAVPTHQRMPVGRMMSWTILQFFPDAQCILVYLDTYMLDSVVLGCKCSQVNIPVTWGSIWDWHFVFSCKVSLVSMHFLLTCAGHWILWKDICWSAFCSPADCNSG